MMRRVLLALSKDDRTRRLATRTAFLRPAVRRFIAGETLEDALGVVADLNRRGLLASLDLLGESTTTADDARRAAAAYGAVLDAVHRRGLRAGISVKLSQLGLDLSVDLAEDLLRGIASAARERHRFVRVDMEDSARLPATLDVFERVWDDGFHNTGIALQAYLYRTPQDVERYLARGVSIRLCKGAYAEPAAIAFPRKADVDRQFARLIERLLAEGTNPAIATHDERLIVQAKTFARAHAIPPDRFEFQFLHGIRRDLQEALAREGFRVRVYVPFGPQWYPYFMRRLAERPANVLFIVRHLLRP